MPIWHLVFSLYCLDISCISQFLLMYLSDTHVFNWPYAVTIFIRQVIEMACLPSTMTKVFALCMLYNLIAVYIDIIITWVIFTDQFWYFFVIIFLSILLFCPLYWTKINTRWLNRIRPFNIIFINFWVWLVWNFIFTLGLKGAISF